MDLGSLRIVHVDRAFVHMADKLIESDTLYLPTGC